MKNLLCKIFGHQPPVYAKRGWYSPGEQYGKLHLRGIDGTGVQHADVYAECARCEEEFMIARLHVPYLTKPGE